MIKAYLDKVPQLDPTVRVAENASVIGEVTAEKNVSIWYGTVVRGDAGPITIGEGTNLQDNCIVHNAVGIPTVLGRNLVVGHGAILHSCTIEDNCLIGMGSILLNGCVIGEGSIVAAGAIVTEHKVFPPRSMLMGIPARVVRQVTEEEVAENIRAAENYIERSAEQFAAAGETDC